MTTSRRVSLLFCLLLLPGAAWAQGSILQTGPSPSGHAPMYTSKGSQTTIGDSGSAGGGTGGMGLSEFLQVNRGAGTGPLGSHTCFYDADPARSTTGYRFFCVDANVNGQGLLSFGAGGVAPPIPFNCNINGVFIADCLEKATGGNVVFNGTGAANILPIFSNNVGTVLGKSSLSETSSQVLSAKPYAAFLQNVSPVVNTAWGATPALIVTTHGLNNGIIGATVSDLPPATVAFNTGTTGFGLLNPGSAGNIVFGLYGEADLADHGTAVGAEIDCFNYKGNFGGGLPPFTPVGSADNNCIGLQVGAGGQFRSALGLHVGPAAGGVYGPNAFPQQWTDGIYIGGSGPGSSAASRYGLFVDADSTGIHGPITSAVIQSYGGINLQLGILGPYQPDNTVLTALDVGAVSHFSVRQSGDIWTTGKMEFNEGTRPTLTSCGTGASVNRSNDQAGTISVGSGTVTSCQIHFASFFKQIPSCVISEFEFTPVLWITGISFNTLTVASRDGISNMASTGFSYHCFDQP